VGNVRGNVAAIQSDDDGLFSDDSSTQRQPSEAANRPGRDPEVMREKARALFDDAMRDFQAGRVGAARMNAKLAAIYDPGNEEYRHALDQWDRAPTGRKSPVVPREVVLYERAQEAESEGDIDRALDLLREGIAVNPDVPAIHNRLGVLLALQKRDYEAAAAAIQRAIELEPDNLHYRNNLGKIVARAQSS
jgi:tetratricopeptide (TPR) repeat protein